MEIRIIRRPGRTKTVSARMVDGEMVVHAPAHVSDDQLATVIDKLRRRIEKRERKKELSDTDLHTLALRLNREYFGGTLRWESISWSTRQDRLAGSCSTREKTIRISHRLAMMPPFVLEYVVVHELAHLLEANHGVLFWELVNRFPRTERARGYLMAVHMEGTEEPPPDLE